MRSKPQPPPPDRDEDCASPAIAGGPGWLDADGVRCERPPDAAAGEPAEPRAESPERQPLRAWSSRARLAALREGSWLLPLRMTSADRVEAHCGHQHRAVVTWPAAGAEPAMVVEPGRALTALKAPLEAAGVEVRFGPQIGMECRTTSATRVLVGPEDERCVVPLPRPWLSEDGRVVAAHLTRPRHPGDHLREPEDHELRVWSAESGGVIGTVPTARLGALSPSGRLLAAVTPFGWLGLFDVGPALRLRWSAGCGPADGLAVEPGGRAVAVACRDGFIRLWDGVGGRCVGERRAPGVTELAFASGGERLVSLAATRLELWELEWAEGVR